ncbi:hypothetical protein JCM19046_4900 [Bacillus sp. JCM 19046]|nr:hypothetical protein JCM19046_4900 [Bacillus sp. JCM 19046]
MATGLFAGGCSQDGSAEYVGALAEKEEGTKFKYTVGVDVTTPNTTEGMHEVLGIWLLISKTWIWVIQ